MVRIVIIVICCLFLGGCTRSTEKRSPNVDSALEVRLETLTVRQYRESELRFHFRADQMRLNENEGLLLASGRIAAELAPALWRGSQP